MAKTQGTIKDLPQGKRFGFIERPSPPGGAKLEDVFFLFGDYPQGQTPAKGDVVEFEIVPGKGNKTRAANIIVITKAAPGNPAPAPTHTAPPAVSVNSPQGRLDGVFVFESPVEKEDTGGNKYDEVLVAIVAKYDGKPVKGVTVECRLWDTLLGPVSRVVTPENGIVFFTANVAKDAIRPYLEATLTYGQETKVVSTYWGPTVPEPVKVVPALASLPPVPAIQPQPDPDRLDVAVAPFPDTKGLFRLTVSIFAGDRKVKGKFAISSSESLKLTATGGTSLGTGANVSLETESDGTKEFLVGFANPVQILVSINLCNKKGKPQQKLLVKP